MSDVDRVYRILSIDGGGIRGVFPAAFLARLQDQLPEHIGSYFDLIAGTSTGGIIALGLGLRIPPKTIIDMYTNNGPAIFGQDHNRITNWLLNKWRWGKHLFHTKYDSQPLRDALTTVLRNQKIGESKSRLLIPSWHRETERVYVYKTAHHERFASDYRQLALDAAMATAAAPTFLEPYLTSDEVELIDGGVWANNPIGAATVEAIGVLGWPANKIRILSIGTLNEAVAPPRLSGGLPFLLTQYVSRVLMAGQSHSAMGTAKLLTGDVHSHQAIWRVDQTAPAGRFSLDNTSRIKQMKDRANVEAREQFPILKNIFFQAPAPRFNPFHTLEGLRQ
ncbi:CBASS cGAMP-activated phospholipase [Aestuariivirga sp.]|uniref:CBASS cGAMP-activated phospholipase n=1 Tax=Aestuariivirga sp. TaxID=2650926 RepID=UPI003BAC66BD